MTSRFSSPLRLTLAISLSLSSWGPGVASAAAQQITGRTGGGAVVARLSAIPIALAAPIMSSPAAVPLPLSPILKPSPLIPTVIGRVAAVPRPVAVVESAKPSAPAEAYGRAASEDFSRRVTGEELAATAPGEPDAASVVFAPSASARPSAAFLGAPTKPEGRKRSAAFPLAMAALSGAVWGGADLARWGAYALSAHSAVSAAGAALLSVAAASAMIFSGAFILNAAVDAVVFAVAMWRGRTVVDAELSSFLRAEVLEGRLDGNAAALVKPYRPDNRYKDFTFAFASRGLIWVRPELTATPWLLRQILLHELHHMKAAAPRGPPRGMLRGALSAFIAEVGARAVEFRGPGALRRMKISGLQRALTQTQTSLRLSRPYDVLVLNPDSDEMEDPKLYDGLSDGAARVTLLKKDKPQEALAEAGRSYRSIVLGHAAGALPQVGSRDALRLDSVLKKLDSLQLLATRLVARGGVFDGSAEAGAWGDLVDRAQRLKASGSDRAVQVLESEVRKLWRQIVSQRLKGVGVSELIEGLYGGLSDHGFAFLPFGPDDKGIVSWEKLLRYWEAADGGQFRVTRVDLENGGHLLILRKVETRVGLWLRPTQGGRIRASVANASLTQEGRATARKSLEDAGFGPQLALFEKMEVVVRHVFGADLGRQEIYVTVPRRNAGVIRKYVSPNYEVQESESNFQTLLMDSAEIQGVKPVWQAGITGAAGSIFWIDTGADSTHGDFGGRLDVVDMVDEGTEDWLGHGTHVAGISISANTSFLGMAKAALGIMGKVFSKDQPGATDGDIQAVAGVAMKKGSDVISLSLGSRGSSADNLAEFFSRLTRLKNASGEYPIVTASAGNSGPFDRTLSQPGAGVEVLAVAAAAKSKDDGVPEIAFYSSVGPDVDRRYALKRLRFKPDITGVGGDVTTEPGSSNVYKNGVYSVKSKDAARSPSDLEDGKHTGMAGTSMSNPAVAAIALLVKLAMRLRGAIKGFVADNLPFAVRAALMRSARDMGVPVWFQGAGLVNAWAAVSQVFESAAALNGWAWLERLKAVQDVEDRVFREGELAKSELQARQEEENSDEPSEEPEGRVAAGNATAAEVQRRFNAARDAELPRLLEALKDPVWLVRRNAAAVLMNMRAPSTAAALAEVGLHDAEPRVRQMALLALAEIETHAIDALLQKAAASEPRDVGVYAAYALARRGDRSAVERIVKELGNPDKRARFTAAWLLGQSRDAAAAAETEGLSARVRDRGERGNIRHLAAASLSNLAAAAPEALSDRVVADLLDASGPENLALTGTIARVFPIAVKSKAFVARLRSEPLKPVITEFVIKNRLAIGKPGKLNELVTLLAQAADIPLDSPTAVRDPTGVGVLGVDETVGPVDLIVIPPSAGSLSEPGIDDQTLARFETTVRAVLPLSRSLWLSVPEHKLYALSITLEHRGWSVRRSLPYYPLSNSASSSATDGLTLELGGGQTRPEIPAGADLSIVRVRSSEGISEVRVMAELERVAAAVKGKGASVVALALAAPTVARDTPLSILLDRMVSSGVGVVVGAGNSGPNLGTVTAPGDSALAMIVAAAGRAGLQFYSSRGTAEAPSVTVAHLVDDLRPGEILSDAADKVFGTGEAAERAATKLAALAHALSEGLAAKGRTLPEGWFQYLTALVRRAAAPMPAYGAHEVGAGLFDSLERTLDLLRARLHDPEALERDAKALASSRGR